MGTFLERSPIAVALLDHEGCILDYNSVLGNLIGNRQPQRGSDRLQDFVEQDSRGIIAQVIDELLTDGEARGRGELGFNNDAGSVCSLYMTAVDPAQKPEEARFFAYLIDMTEQRNLEMRFTHSQKMQAVGQLAGGIAHDFNNLLTAMIGFCDLLLMRHPAGDQSFADIMQIKQNANRAANLVRQLLAFSRRQTLQPKTLDLTDVLAELSNLIRRLIGENIELRMIHGRDLGLVRADQGQIEQVIINLAVNARDAMPEGGTLTIQTGNVSVTQTDIINKKLVSPAEDDQIIPGDYVLVEVMDTGTGIPPAILRKIFEPFFSTKEVGSGTGLGLATVYGIIKQTEGYIFVHSEEGNGTSFSIYLKRYEQAESSGEATGEHGERATASDLSGKGTILLVEDEAPVRIFSARALRNKGYTVLEADCAESALKIIAEQGKDIQLIITDVIMPGMNGPAMIKEISGDYPDIDVIFISGYAEDAFLKSFGPEREFNFLPKPFTLKQLASKVKEVMRKD